MNIGGLNKDQELIEARKICAFCNEEFDDNESKTETDGDFYHLDCFDELQYKINDYVHERKDKEV